MVFLTLVSKNPAVHCSC